MSDGKLLRVTEAADFLGVSQRGLLYWIKNGKGPRYIRFTDKGQRYFRRQDLVLWLESHAHAGNLGPNGSSDD